MRPLWIFVHGLCALFATLGVALLVAGLRDVLRAFRSRRWPTTAGVITSTELLQSPRTVETSSGARSQLHYEARIHYEYTLGHTHVGSSALSLNSTETRSEVRARAVLSRYPQGHPVQVSYNPADPTEAVLEPGLHPVDLARGFVGFVFLLVAGGLELAAHWLSSRL